MGNFDLRRARGSLPGRGTQVRANLDVRTGGQQIAQAVSAMGGSIANLGEKYYNIQAATQLSQAQRIAIEKMNTLSLSLEGNLNPEKYQDEYNKTLDDIEKSTSSILTNKMAANDFALFRNQREPYWQKGIDNYKRARIKDNSIAEMFAKQALQVQTGELGEFPKYLAKLVSEGMIDRSDAVKELIETKNRIEIRLRADEVRRKAEAKEQRAQYIEKVEQEFLVKLRDKLLNENDVMDSALDVDEKQEWIGYIEKQRERILSGADIITDQARKHELLDMAAAINWPERKVTAQEVRNLARKGRYGADANLDDAAFDEVRDAVRRAEEDKIPFTQREIEKTIGELITGAPSSVLGLPLPTLRTREDAIKHATNAFGRFVNRIPGVMDTINAKFPPEKHKSTPSEPKDNPVYDFDGELIGGYNPDGSITLNWEGLTRLWEISGRNAEKTREIAAQNRYVLPQALTLPSEE